MPFDTLKLDHVGIRVTNLAIAEAFYGKLGFVRDPEEFSPAARACGLVHSTGLRIHLIYNGEAADEGNVLLDAPIKRPGYTPRPSSLTAWRSWSPGWTGKVSGSARARS